MSCVYEKCAHFQRRTTKGLRWIYVMIESHHKFQFPHASFEERFNVKATERLKIHYRINSFKMSLDLEEINI